MERIAIFDSTLRDGEQTPGATLNEAEKLEIARQLARLQVDVIEAGFPISSPGDFRACQAIARQVKGPVITALARTVKEDIDRVWEAIKDAEKPRIHIFLGASDIHISKKLRSNPDKIIATAVESVRYAKKMTGDVEYSLEDASRAQPDFIYRLVDAVIAAGATVVNVPDTVGYAVPEEYGALVRNIREKVPASDQIIVSVHCHNDLGLAVANSLAAIKNGARQVECNMNGIGERAGNAALEEIVLALKIRPDFYNYETGINLKEISRTSRMVANLTGIPIPVNKAVVGVNAFAHSSGIHQDGILKDRSTYEIIDAETIGRQPLQIVLTARSGRHAVRHQLEQLGYQLQDDEFEQYFRRFMDLADKKKEIFAADLEALLTEQVKEVVPTYELRYLQTVSGSNSIPAAVVRLTSSEGTHEQVASGAGPIDAACNAIDKITGINPRLATYDLRALTQGRDAQGEVTLKLDYQGRTIIGRGSSTDIIEASIKAYLNGINQIIASGITAAEKRGQTG